VSSTGSSSLYIYEIATDTIIYEATLLGYGCRTMTWSNDSKYLYAASQSDSGLTRVEIVSTTPTVVCVEESVPSVIGATFSTTFKIQYSEITGCIIGLTQETGPIYKVFSYDWDTATVEVSVFSLPAGAVYGATM
jgi:hypothetical protein